MKRFYRDILQTLEQETGHNLNEFLIPDSELRFKTNSIPPTLYNDFQGKTSQSEYRYCERAFFLMRLNAVITFFSYLTPKSEQRQIGF